MATPDDTGPRCSEGSGGLAAQDRRRRNPASAIEPGVMASGLDGGQSGGRQHGAIADFVRLHDLLSGLGPGDWVYVTDWRIHGTCQLVGLERSSGRSGTPSVVPSVIPHNLPPQRQISTQPDRSRPQKGQAGRAWLPERRQLPAAAAVALRRQVADSPNCKAATSIPPLGGGALPSRRPKERTWLRIQRLTGGPWSR